MINFKKLAEEAIKGKVEGMKGKVATALQSAGIKAAIRAAVLDIAPDLADEITAKACAGMVAAVVGGPKAPGKTEAELDADKAKLLFFVRQHPGSTGEQIFEGTGLRTSSQAFVALKASGTFVSEGKARNTKYSEA